MQPSDLSDSLLHESENCDSESRPSDSAESEEDNGSIQWIERISYKIL